MSNPTGFAISRRFAVKDIDALKAVLSQTEGPVEVTVHEHEGRQLVSLLATDGFWPETILPLEDIGTVEPTAEQTFIGYLSTQVLPGELAILESVSFQGLTLRAEVMGIDSESTSASGTTLDSVTAEMFYELGGEDHNLIKADGTGGDE